MKKLSAMLLGLLMCSFMSAASAQDSKPYKEGQVTEVSYIKVKPGKFNDYMKWLGSSYKQLMEANKKAGLIVTYAVYSATPRSANEPDLILTITYPNMAALDRIDESEAVAAKLLGSMDAQGKAFADRGTMREVLGSELIRELVLR